MILCDWGKIHGSLGGLEMINGEGKSEVPSDRPWGAAPTRATHDSLFLTCSGTPHQPERLRPKSVRQALTLHASERATDAQRPRSFHIFWY